MRRREFLTIASGILAALQRGALAKSLTNDITITKINLAQHFPQYAVGLRIVFVADIHDGPYLDENLYISLFDCVKNEKPDLLLLGGDYLYVPYSASSLLLHGLSPRNGAFIGKSKHDHAVQAIERLQQKISSFPEVYMVLGNHDRHNMFSHLLRPLAPHLLINRKINLTIKGLPLEIYGSDDFITGFPRKSRFKNFDSFKIVIAHNPDHFYYMEDRRFHLGLSGHTHWGQISLPIIGPATYNVQNPKYYEGLVMENPTNPNIIYVTAGVGTVEMPIRYEVPREVVIFEL